MVQGHVQACYLQIAALSDIQMSSTCIRFILALLQNLTIYIIKV